MFFKELIKKNIFHIVFLKIENIFVKKGFSPDPMGENSGSGSKDNVFGFTTLLIRTV